MGPQDLLDALDEIVYVSDPNTYELLYANRRCRSLLPTRDYKGKPCYALLQGQPAPCPYCTNARLTPDKFYVWEFNNPSMGRHFLLKDKLIDWDGRPARLEIAVDITEQELLSRDTARKLETERTLVECIRRLMDAASSREAAQAVLSCVGGFYQASHAFLLELHASGRSVHCTQMWTAADAEPLELPSISLSNGSLLNRLLESPQAQCILAERLGPEYRQVAAQMQDAGGSAPCYLRRCRTRSAAACWALQMPPPALTIHACWNRWPTLSVPNCRAGACSPVWNTKTVTTRSPGWKTVCNTSVFWPVPFPPAPSARYSATSTASSRSTTAAATAGATPLSCRQQTYCAPASPARTSTA